MVHTPGTYSSTALAAFTADQVLDPVSGLPGLRARLLDADGGELLSEHRTSGRLIYLGVDALDRTAEVEVTARLRATESGVHRIGLAGAGPMRLEIDGEVRIDEVVALETGDPVEAFLNPRSVTSRHTWTRARRWPTGWSTPRSAVASARSS